mgnify:CR=1 FL=1
MKKIKFFVLFLFFYVPISFSNEVAFSKDIPSAKDIVLMAIKESKKSMHIAAYQFTEKEILQAIIDQNKKGVDVSVILDKTQKNGDFQKMLVKNKIKCKIDAKHKIMHHKFIIIDENAVQTGSFNYTNNAVKFNAENAIYISDKNIAKKYIDEFNKINDIAIDCKG